MGIDKTHQNGYNYVKMIELFQLETMEHNDEQTHAPK